MTIQTEHTWKGPISAQGIRMCNVMEAALNNEDTKHFLRKIVSFLNNHDEDGGFWLPNIQRPFVWSEDQICRLFDSILREYPISTLLIWKTRAEVRHRKFIDNYRSKLRLSDFYVPENDRKKCLVLDGQQRLQSLFIGLCGSYEGRELFLDILSGEVSAPDDVKFGCLSRQANTAFVDRFKDGLQAAVAYRRGGPDRQSGPRTLLMNVAKSAATSASYSRLFIPTTGFHETDGTENADSAKTTLWRSLYGLIPAARLGKSICFFLAETKTGRRRTDGGPCRTSAATASHSLVISFEIMPYLLNQGAL